MLVRKSVKQRYSPSSEVLELMRNFKAMVNDCIRIGLENNVSSMKRLSLLSYQYLKRYDVCSYYRLTANSKAAGILSARKKSIKRGYQTKNPYMKKLILTSCYYLKIIDGGLIIPLGGRNYESIPLNNYIQRNVLTDLTLRVCSFTLTEKSLSLCISKEVPEVKVDDLTSTVGVDRNIRNLTVGNQQQVTYYDMSKVVEISETTRSIVKSFKRNDVRIRRKIASKYGQRRSERVKRILHKITKDVVQKAKLNKQAIVFEELKGIRNLYRKGNGQGPHYRGMMNGWPFHEVKRQIEYKAAWEGVKVITLSRNETKGTTVDCPRCGERLQSATRGDKQHYRQLWCERCEKWIDRDLAAVLNISHRGWLRFDHSKGEADEVVKGNPTIPVILRVDASKLRRRSDS